jgi:probable phosphoglycerate mutase
LRERISQCVNELASQHLGEQIVLVSHGGVMDALYRLATNQSVQAPRTWHLGNAAINRLLWTPQGLSLVGWGDVSHFDEAFGSPLDEVTT